MLLRPIVEDDRAFYTQLLRDPEVMSNYLGGPWSAAKLTCRFDAWLSRWKLHPFSAMAVIDTRLDQPIGHAVLGHGCFDGRVEEGWSEVAIVLDRTSWNCDFADSSQSVGTRNQRGIGTEVIRALTAYARALQVAGYQVPLDIPPDRVSEVSDLFTRGRLSKCFRADDGQLSAALFPFSGIWASVDGGNTASRRAFERVFVRENGGHRVSMPHQDRGGAIFELDFSSQSRPADVRQ
jgi:RimJ/RimL family protein N-acetyltransferase